VSLDPTAVQQLCALLATGTRAAAVVEPGGDGGGGAAAAISRLRWVRPFLSWEGASQTLHGLRAPPWLRTVASAVCDLDWELELPSSSSSSSSSSASLAGPSGAIIGSVSHSCACIGSPCLRHCVHGASIGGFHHRPEGWRQPSCRGGGAAPPDPTVRDC
jgi:hypothetical protein